MYNPKMIARTKVCRSKFGSGGEIRVKAWNAEGNRLREADYFTDDREDAYATSLRMICLPKLRQEISACMDDNGNSRKAWIVYGDRGEVHSFWENSADASNCLPSELRALPCLPDFRVTLEDWNVTVVTFGSND